MYDPKYAMARTKSEAIVVNVLYPYINTIDANDIKDSKFISLAVDTSNHNSTKLAPVLIHYFKPRGGSRGLGSSEPSSAGVPTLKNSI